MKRYLCLIAIWLSFPFVVLNALAEPPDGFVSLFDGRTLGGWVVPENDNGHWKVIDGVIDYDAASEAAEWDRDLWTEQSYRDFVLLIDWRLKATPFVNRQAAVIRPDGSHKLGADGKEILLSIPDADSGIFLRGFRKAQVNIWCWPVGSGGVFGYRMDPNLPPDIHAGATPSVNADNNIGEWNRFEITLRGERLSVKLNGRQVIHDTVLPQIPQAGPIGIQHHGDRDKEGNWLSSPSLIQVRNIWIKAL